MPKRFRISHYLKRLLVSSLSLALFTSGTAYSFAYNNADLQKRIFFEGHLQGTEVDVLEGSPPEFIDATGAIPGLATQLTEFTLKYHLSVGLSDGSAKGTGELIDVSGDSVFVSIIGQNEPTSTKTPTISSIVEIDTITGGTGRFAGAVGTLTVRRLIDLTTGFTSGTICGTIASPGREARNR